MLSFFPSLPLLLLFSFSMFSLSPPHSFNHQPHHHPSPFLPSPISSLSFVSLFTPFSSSILFSLLPHRPPLSPLLSFPLSPLLLSFLTSTSNLLLYHLFLISSLHHLLRCLFYLLLLFISFLHLMLPYLVIHLFSLSSFSLIFFPLLFLILFLLTLLFFLSCSLSSFFYPLHP